MSALLAAMLLAASLQASPLEPPTSLERPTILSINVESGGRANPRAVLRQFALRPGDEFDPEAWQADVQRMLNLGVVSKASTELSEAECGGVHVDLRVTPAFPILPILNYQTGSVNVLMAGAFNANLGRELFDAGAYYVRRDSHNLARAWVMLPNLVRRNSMLEVQMVMTASTLELYGGPLGDGALAAEPPDASMRWRVPDAGFEILRRGFFIDYGQELLPRLTLAGRYLLFKETVFDLPNIRAVVDSRDRGLDPVSFEREEWDDAWLSLLALNVVLGQVDIVQGYRFTGQDLRLIGVGSSRLLGSRREHLQGYATWRGFMNIGRRWDLAGNAAVGASTSDHPADLFTLGGDNLDPFVHRNKFLGLMNIRGFRATQFHGTRIGFTNVEARFTPIFELPLWLIGGFTPQLAAFVDAGHAWDGRPELDGLLDSGALSAGAGVLLTFLDLPYTYLNWYAARRIRPDEEWTAAILLMRPMY